MKRPARPTPAGFLALLMLLLALLVPHGRALAEERPAFSPQQLEQMLAPIALYPDPLLSQILMASTYPLEVVAAARWARSHANLIGEEAVRAAGQENWDPSVKSLLAFPQVLARMDENLQWLQNLGDAFLGQEPQVMDTVQNLRQRARLAGNLYSDARQSIVETGPSLVIQPADPLIIYVPYYDPGLVYGPWWLPNHAPFHWQPFPGYYVLPGLASGFYWGPSIRISVGYFFGGFDWPRRHVRIVRSNYHYSAAVIQSTNSMHRARQPGRWIHDPAHRRGVAYRGTDVRQRFADPGGRNSGNPFAREDAHRPDPRRAQSFPPSPRHNDAIRPIVHAAVQPGGPVKADAATRPPAPPQPRSDRRGEPRDDARPTAVRPAPQAPVQPALQPAAARPAAGTHPRAERREQFKDLDRGGRSGPVESRQAARSAHAVPEMPGNRGNAIGDRAEGSVPPHVRGSNHEPRPSPAKRQEAQPGVEPSWASQGRPEARPDSGWQRRASTGNVLPPPSPLR